MALEMIEQGPALRWQPPRLCRTLREADAASQPAHGSHGENGSTSAGQAGPNARQLDPQ